MRSKRPILPALLAIVAIGFAVSPALTTGFAGFRPEQFPIAQDFWPIQPAGWAFSIWGVIYLWLIIGTSWGAINAAEDLDWQPARLPLIVSLGIGMFWIAAANASPILATVMIWLMAGFAIRAMLLSGRHSPALQARPIALYAGWLTAASGVGSGVVLGGYGLLGTQAAAYAMLVLVLVIALLVQSLRKVDWAYPLAVCWALSGVIAANIASGNWGVMALSAIGIALLLAGYTQGLLRDRPPSNG